MVVNFTMPSKYETAAEGEKIEKSAEAPLAAVAAVQKAHPELRVEEFGDASAAKALGATERADEAKSMQFSMGGTLLILLLAFGAAVAAGVPLLLGVSAFVATTGCSDRSASSARCTRPSGRSRCSSAWPSASTTRCSTCAG